MALRRALVLILPLLLLACGGPEEVDRAPQDDASRETRRRQEAEAERVGFPVEVSNDFDMRFRLIPCAQFVMGTKEEEPGHTEDEPAHEVHLITPCYVQTREVTNAQFRAFRPEHSSGTMEDGRSLDGEDQPVVGVSHVDALAFAAWLEKQDPRWRYRLPTEGEWEYACRNDFGIQDLPGGVAEWCHDLYGPYPLWRQDNPQGSSSGTEYVVRGATLGDAPEGCRCARRARRAPDHRDWALGFRLAMSLGYARHDFGRYAVTYRTVDPTASGEQPALRPGYHLKMISVVDRLTDRRNRPDVRPIWTDVRGTSPQVVHLPPGRYYVYAVRQEDGAWIRGQEVKFDVPDRDVIDAPVPRTDQEAPQ